MQSATTTNKQCELNYKFRFFFVCVALLVVLSICCYGMACGETGFIAKCQHCYN